MKVIFIKNHEKGQKNEIKDFASGYAKNFLIKNHIAIPYNEKNLKITKKVIAKKIVDDQKLKQNLMLLKQKIESLKPIFYLKSHDLKIFGSITRKQILKFLRDNQIARIENYQIKQIKIKSFGKNKVIINLGKDIFANLIIEVKADG